MGRRDDVTQTLTVTEGVTKGVTDGGQGAASAAAMADTLDAPAPVAPAMADTLDAPAPSAGAPPRSSPKEAATLSLAPGAGLDPALEMGLAADEPPPIPSRLSSLPRSLADRFESLQFLGEGGMGAVYRAKDRRLGRDIALKFLFGGGEETNQRLLREARSQARLEHENACKVYEAGVADGHRYIVMQYIDGQALDEAAKGMTLEEKVRVIRQIASALHDAHRLGLVHRDIKPSNIMVERCDDGAWKPYLMDFGLARDVGERGQTATGSIAGTPAFMAPEQAIGNVRSLDRRTDVYSLGATLYDVVCGRPPFMDENLFRLLQRVAREDPPPLRKVSPATPEDIDAIVMKCLEKEPGRRYDSARALGDELQRFLDGEPVLARRASLAYVALKKVRRHKGKVALAGAALVAVLVVIALWVRERQLAAERARISTELGEDVKEMELFLRSAYGLPLHDIEREKDVVRARLRGVSERMAAAGPAGEGPGSYAIGRGLLALHEPDRAVEHLERAVASGYSSPELDYAEGLALGELYKRALDAAKRIENAEQKKARVAAIEASLKEPALRHLRAALGQSIEVPAYVEGLIALYEGKNEEARALAEEAFKKAPWLPDAKKLEGDAHFAEGSRFRPDAAFDYDKMMLHFNRAAAAYASAAEIARSSPEVHVAECELWIQVMSASQGRPESLADSFEKAKLACDRGIQASSRGGEARVKTAFAYMMLAWLVQDMPSAPYKPEAVIQEAIGRAEEAVRVSPDDPMASYLLGAAFRTQWLLLMNRGEDPGASIQRSIAAYEAAIRLEPTFLWALNELCSTYAASARLEGFLDKDPAASLAKAVERCDRAIAIDPSFTFPYTNKALAHYSMAQHLVDIGAPPDAALRAALDASAAATAKSPDSLAPLAAAGGAHVIRAAHDMEAGRDPGASIALAEQQLQRVEALAPTLTPTNELRARIALVKAVRLLRSGGDPEPAIREARTAADRVLHDAPTDIDYRILRAQIEIAGARAALRQGKAPPAEFEAAREGLASLLDKDRAWPHLYQTLAEMHEIRASSLLDRKKSAGEEIKTGLEMADRALAKSPSMAAARSVKATLTALLNR